MLMVGSWLVLHTSIWAVAASINAWSPHVQVPSFENWLSDLQAWRQVWGFDTEDSLNHQGLSLLNPFKLPKHPASLRSLLTLARLSITPHTHTHTTSVVAAGADSSVSGSTTWSHTEVDNQNLAGFHTKQKDLLSIVAEMLDCYKLQASFWILQNTFEVVTRWEVEMAMFLLLFLVKMCLHPEAVVMRLLTRHRISALIQEKNFPSSKTLQETF